MIYGSWIEGFEEAVFVDMEEVGLNMDKKTKNPSECNLVESTGVHGQRSDLGFNSFRSKHFCYNVIYRLSGHSFRRQRRQK